MYKSPAEVSDFRVFIKPDRGQGSQGTATARNAEELAALFVQNSDRIITAVLHL
jgi:biotin carboxylase